MWVSTGIGKNQAKSKEIKAFNSMYSMDSMVKAFKLTPKEINILNYEGIDILNFVDYETMWINERITDKEFDIIQKFATNLGYQVATRKELEEDD